MIKKTGIKAVVNFFLKGGILFVFLLFFAASLIVPELLLAFVAANFALCILVLALRFRAVLLPKKNHSPEARLDTPKISIHIPTYNEPPEVVISTLEAIQRLHYSNFEVIVLDNNTTNPDFWKPVENFIHHQNDARLRFFHEDNVEGYKAGALNICLERTHPEAEFVLVIDADYRVSPELIDEALGQFNSRQTGLVQFPQAYFNTGLENRGITDEYEHFFSVYMNMANHYDCVLSTGTVSFIRLEALRKAGRWKDRTITEDVELGLRLKNSGYRSKYIPKALGRGLMPTDGKALRTQRERWIYGNMQTLMLFWKTDWKNIRLKQTLGIITMLTAWFNFLFFPFLGILASTILSFYAESEAVHTLLHLSLWSVATYVLATLIFFVIAFRGMLNRAFGAFLVNSGLAYEGALSWLAGLFRTKLGFKRTNKFPKLGSWTDYLPGLILTLIVATMLTVFIASGDGLAAWLSLSLTPLAISTFYLKRQLDATAKITSEKTTL